MADYGNMRKKLLIVTAIAGSLLTISVSFFTNPSLYWVIGILIVLTNVLYGSSIVFYNAFLPLLVKSHPEYTEAPNDKKLEVSRQEIFFDIQIMQGSLDKRARVYVLGIEYVVFTLSIKGN